MNETDKPEYKHRGSGSELSGLVMPESWSKTLADAQKHLIGDCPLTDDEDIVRAGYVIEELLRILQWNICVFSVSDEAVDAEKKVIETLKRELNNAGILIEA